MRVLVIGGTGGVGTALVAELRARGLVAVAGSRHPGPDGTALDLADPASVEAAARGFDAVWLQTPIGAHEAALGVAAVEALARAGVGRVAFMAIHNLETMTDIPHFAAKVPIKAAVLALAGGMVVEPGFFMQNDLLGAGAIQAGVYPLPIGAAGVWSIDTRDLAAAAAGLIAAERPPRVTALCGPEPLTGPALAANWAAALGRPVHYGGDAVAPFLAALGRAMPLDAWLHDDMERMLTVTQARGCPATPADLAATRAALGRPPCTHRAFAEVTAHNWTQSPPARMSPSAPARVALGPDAQE